MYRICCVLGSDFPGEFYYYTEPRLACGKSANGHLEPARPADAKWHLAITAQQTLTKRLLRISRLILTATTLHLMC